MGEEGGAGTITASLWKFKCRKPAEKKGHNVHSSQRVKKQPEHPPAGDWVHTKGSPTQCDVGHERERGCDTRYNVDGP